MFNKCNENEKASYVHLDNPFLATRNAVDLDHAAIRHSLSTAVLATLVPNIFVGRLSRERT